MNLPALWAYGAGLTTGLAYRYLQKPTEPWMRGVFVVCFVTVLWPIVALAFVIDWYQDNLRRP